MKIYIMSSGRSSRQTTWNNLPNQIRKDTMLVVPVDEVPDYAAFPVLHRPEIVRDVTHARQILVSSETGKICMLDDDLTFATRSVENPTKFVASTEEQVVGMFRDIEKKLDTYAHAGVSAREGANYQTSQYLRTTRMMRILAYDTQILNTHGIRYDRLKFMADFDVTLQLLRKGLTNCIVNYMVQNQTGSNASGGCSQYRTREAQEQDAHLLQELHPDFVKLSTKKTKQKGMWSERLDVTIQWKKAYRSSGACDAH